jgi:hypothetical protein
MTMMLKCVPRISFNMFQVNTFISSDNNNKILNILVVNTSYVYFGIMGIFLPFHFKDINLAIFNRQFNGA